MIDVVNKFNMVDMGGIDIVESQGVAVEGLFNRLLSAIQNCRYQTLYNWKFAKIEIAPSYVELVFDGIRVYINEAVSVTEDDVVHVYSLEPEPVVPAIEPLAVSENGTYTAPSGIDGYSPITVNVVPVIEPLTVIENGEYEAPSGVDGYSPITVNVSGGGESPIRSISIISAPSIFTEFECDGQQLPQNLKKYPDVTGQFFITNALNILYSKMSAANTSATIYAVIKSLTSDGDFAGVSFAYDTSTWNFPLFYTRDNVWNGGTYANDFSTGISSNVFRVLALAVDNSTKTARFFIDGTKMSTEKQFSNSGKCAGWGGGILNGGTIALANVFDVRYGALVQGVETDEDILANMALVSTQYANILGT